MELKLLKKGIIYTRKGRNLIYGLGALVVTTYGAYRVYHLPSVIKKRQRLIKLLGIFVSVIEMVSDSAEAIGVVSKDLKEFVQSDSDEIPRSLKQISKITYSDEFSGSVTSITKAVTEGMLKGYRCESETLRGDVKMSETERFSDRVLDKLFSDSGSGFAANVIGSFTKNFAMAYYSHKPRNVEDLETGNSPKWIDVVSNEKYRVVIGDYIQKFVSSAVSVYLDKTMNINTYDDIFSGLTNPKHEKEIKEMLVSVSNGAVETFVRTSHNVLTNSGSNKNSNPKFSMLPIDISENLKHLDKMNKGGIWMRHLSSTFAVSSNKRFVLDLTGRVTFETVRSFLKFLIGKLCECLRRSVDVVEETVVQKGVEAFRYVSRKTTVVVTICISLYLHIWRTPWFLVHL
ncbi:hypothetical protein LIER_28828 [Lithospermum erythrorhizon]|uniref:Protein PHLOEM PROTEIN 2-LIKE A10 n=1 Tax=Lithospermum erythrorhizon TaxID=34254 RepID=A0AAV3RHH3_LITER